MKESFHEQDLYKLRRILNSKGASNKYINRVTQSYDIDFVYECLELLESLNSNYTLIELAYYLRNLDYPLQA